MKYINMVLAALLVMAVLYLGYGFTQLRTEMLKVYDVEDKYALTSPSADLTIVDFSKFGCDHCRNLHHVLMEAIKKDGHVRYVPRLVTSGIVWPEALATAVYAAAEQGKFIEMQNMIYKHWPVKTRKDLIMFAEVLDMDTKRFSRDLSDSDLIDRMREDQIYFNVWRLDRTPTLLLGGENIYQPGEKTPTLEELLEYFAKARG